jgi:beta-N-acetylhexosaminidase
MFIARKRILFIIAIALMLCGVATAAPAGTQVTAKNNPYGLPKELFKLWNSLTLEEKVGQMVMVYMSPPDFVIENNLGGVLVMGAHLSTRNQLQKNLKNIASRAKIPLLVTIDQEGGHVNRIRSLDRKWEKAPSAKEMREMAPEKIERTAREIGATLKKTGINLNLAPAIDPPSDINGRETFMELHGRSWGGIENIEKARAFVKGMKASGIISAAKHFPGYDSETNSDLQMAESDATEDKIRENVAPFKALAPDAPVIMMSSVRYTKISDAPAVFEPKIVKMAHDIDDDIVVLTDDLWGTNLRAWISGPEAPLPNPYPASEFKKVVKAALDAGNDMFMTTYPTKAVDMKNTLLELARQSDDYLVRIEKSVARILKMKFRAGLLTRH